MEFVGPFWRFFLSFLFMFKGILPVFFRCSGPQGRRQGGLFLLLCAMLLLAQPSFVALAVEANNSFPWGVQNTSCSLEFTHSGQMAKDKTTGSIPTCPASTALCCPTFLLASPGPAPQAPHGLCFVSYEPDLHSSIEGTLHRNVPCRGPPASLAVTLTPMPFPAFRQLHSQPQRERFWL